MTETGDAGAETGADGETDARARDLLAGLEPRNEKLRARAVRIAAARLNADRETVRERLEAVGWDPDAL